MSHVATSAAPGLLARLGAGGRMRAWPQTPFVEGPDLVAHLDRIGADAETRRFAHELADTGVGRIDLGEAGRRLCDAVVADMEPYFADPKVVRVQDSWLRSKAVRRLAVLPKIVRTLSQTYGRPAFAFQTLNFKRGSQQALHSDTVHFHSDPPRFMCGVWIALEDIEPVCGPLTYVPESHKLPILTMHGAGVNNAKPSIEDYERIYIPAMNARLAATRLPQAEAMLKKGEALVWAANLAHGGAPIIDPDSTRRSLVVHFFFEGCVYFTPRHSHVEAGELKLRLPANVKTRGWVWPRRDGKRVPVTMHTFLGACAKRLGRTITTKTV